jgi:hypothetical protein
MASKNSKRVGAVATLAAALTMMGGAAFASSGSGTVGYQEPINPGGILGGAYAVVVAAIQDNS